LTTNDERALLHRVFIVDDHPLIRSVLTQILNLEANLEVVGTAASAEVALEAYDQTSPDLLLIDYSLPGMNGAELAKRVRHMHPELPCLILSSWRAQALIKTALDAGANGYVVKGDPEALIDAINQVVDGEKIGFVGS
jgi:DNA-binding NarL/FixJ family response regulator